MAILIQFLFSFTLVLIRRFLPFLKRIFPFFSSYSGTAAYLIFSIALCSSFIAAANEIIDSVSPSALSNKFIAAGFSYLPGNFSTCANIILSAELISFLFNMKDKIYRYIRSFIIKSSK
ncbi:hypothetical protein [Escherichia coli]|uniref:hypothetical protein n=1 Tax=Escherichia coli TaxID=562 RepID=UPI000B7CFE5C|nr:hypothetical protein [Escherichia coli]EEZ5826975.1 hypothetical protein [Escherichia coli]EFB5295984.1 hypothetical protein [Escherichia coli]EFN1744564.1 hypothetical protein [Escherichia coli]EIJ6706750.1 hypothetical protein [Escherichia coli]ELR3255741.1 hypothetical protein [Escherichia coli]